MRVKKYKSKYKTIKKKKTLVTIEKNGILKNEHVNIKSYKKKNIDSKIKNNVTMQTIFMVLMNDSYSSVIFGVKFDLDKRFIGIHRVPSFPSVP